MALNGVGFSTPFSPNVNFTSGWGNTPQLSMDDLSTFYNEAYSGQQEVWKREDNAVQRHVADLKAAGLNPWLAVSSGTSGAATSESPSKSGLDALMTYLGLILQSRNQADTHSRGLLSSLVKVLTPLYALAG